MAEESDATSGKNLHLVVHPGASFAGSVPRILGHIIQDVDSHFFPDGQQACRTVHESGLTDSLLSPFLNNWHSIQLNYWSKAVVLSALVSVPASASADPSAAPGAQPTSEQRLKLTTLFSDDPPAALLSRVFPSGEPALAPQPEEGSCPDHLRIWTGVSVESGGGGWDAPLSREQLQGAPLTLRAAIKAGRQQHLLAALAGCIRAHWPGGVFALAPSTSALLPPDARLPLDQLARPRRISSLRRPACLK